jgi:hypothetical protein
MQRRRFLFRVSAGLFGLSQALQIDALDRLAAATLNLRRSSSGGSTKSVAPPGKNFYNTTPAQLRSQQQQQYSNYHIVPSGPIVDDDVDDPTNHGQTDAKRIARHGRPPSRWLRSLEATELSEWLKTVRTPHTGVTGMTYHTHLTRDHLFKAENLAGLTGDELAKLHSAAHAGY